MFLVSFNKIKTYYVFLWSGHHFSLLYLFYLPNNIFVHPFNRCIGNFDSDVCV
jgi:hypothetical protein